MSDGDDYTGDGSEFVPIDRPHPQFKTEECPHPYCYGVAPQLYCVGCDAEWDKVESPTRNRMRQYLQDVSRDSAAGDDRSPLAFLCRELDDIRKQLRKALAQLAMMGLPEPAAEGAHVHRKVFSSEVLLTYPQTREWICAECLEQGKDVGPRPRTGPTYEEIVAKKRERSGG